MIIELRNRSSFFHSQFKNDWTVVIFGIKMFVLLSITILLIKFVLILSPVLMVKTVMK